MEHGRTGARALSRPEIYFWKQKGLLAARFPVFPAGSMSLKWRGPETN